MIQTIDLRNSQLTRSELLALIPRAVTDVSVATAAAAELIAEVRHEGAHALIAQAERLDGVRPPHVRVPEADIRSAAQSLDDSVRAAMVEAIDRVRKVSRAQVPPPALTRLGEGAVVEQRWAPVERVGLYVPGGKAVYPSSVIMNVVPAQVAGVTSIALASPAQRHSGGSVHPTILAAAALLGVTEVYAMGGAGAIGAFAYGVDEIGLDPVQVITGPGNVYVAAAKRLVRGVTGIDSEAGPTEILIIADESADPALVAADLVSQAEHDELAAAVLVTDSQFLAEAVEGELRRQSDATPHSARVYQALMGRQSAVVLVDSLREAIAFSNAYGPEHLEIHTGNDESVLGDITNAGAIFMGRNSPVSLGDYLAGSNHVLPTGGQARFSSGLGAYTFLRPQQIIRYTAEGLHGVAAHIDALARAEDLPAHAEAVRIRMSRDNSA